MDAGRTDGDRIPPRVEPPAIELDAAGRLDSWKEIAGYLKHSVGTVQRWERREGLPVHRHSHLKRDSVYAFVAEIDAWLGNRGLRKGPVGAWRGWLGKGLAALGLMLLIAAGVHFTWPGLFGVSSAVPFATRDWVLLADLDNSTGDPVFDRSLLTALAVYLEQSPRLNVLPRRRIQDTLRRMGKSDEDRIDESLGREICLRENARVLITSGISRMGSEYILSVRLLDPQTGAGLRAYLERSTKQDEIIGALGRIAAGIRRDLGESLASAGKNGRPLPQVTTPSLQALRLYAEGQDLWSKGEYFEAVNLYDSALDRDPDFAMAHAALGSAYGSSVFSEPAKSKQHFEKALRLAGRISERERLLIEAAYRGSIGPVEDAVRAYKIYLAAYPDDSLTRYDLGSLLMRDGRFQEAVEQLKEVVRVEPASASALVNLAIACGELNQSQEALSYYVRAFQQEPSWIAKGNINEDYGFTLVYSGDRAKAREVFAQALTTPEIKASGLRSLALLDMYEGRYNDAAAQLREAILLSNSRETLPRRTRDQLFLALLQDSNGDHTGCQRELDQSLQGLGERDPRQDWLRARIAVAYARAGAVQKAEQILGALPPDLSERRQLEGEIALARGDYARATELLLAADRAARTPLTLASLARAYLRMGQPEVSALYNEALIAAGRRALGWEPQLDYMVAHVTLAGFYLSHGERARAAKLLDPMMEVWKNADPDLPLIRQARSLRMGLEGGAAHP